MFHHFHNDVHPKTQGSLSADQFEQMLDWLVAHYNLLSADEYRARVLDNHISADDICLSFDDGLKCQYDIAAPILRARHLRAFFFIYTSIFDDKPDYLEIFRYFRTVVYETVDAFYEDFFTKMRARYEEIHHTHWQKFQNIDYLTQFSFYSEEDRWFRYVRDVALTQAQYEKLMLDMMAEKNFNAHSVMKKLWLSESEVKELADAGHVIGLHSHHHPTMIDELPLVEQKKEYQANASYLKRMLNRDMIDVMAHPCGRYNADSIKALQDLGIKLGFCSSLSADAINSPLEIPREDHAHILSYMLT